MVWEGTGEAILAGLYPDVSFFIAAGRGRIFTHRWAKSEAERGVIHGARDVLAEPVVAPSLVSILRSPGCSSSALEFDANPDPPGFGRFSRRSSGIMRASLVCRRGKGWGRGIWGRNRRREGEARAAIRRRGLRFATWKCRIISVGHETYPSPGLICCRCWRCMRSGSSCFGRIIAIRPN